MPYTIIGMVDVTDFVAPDSEENGSQQSGGIQFSANLNDPMTTYDFMVDDINQTINVQNIQSVIIFDENAAPTYKANGTPIPTVPSMNFALNPLLSHSTNVAPPNWTQSGTLPGGVFTYPFNQILFTANNNTNAQYSLQTQTLGLGYVVAGQQYMLSIYMTGSGTIAGFQTLLELTFFDINGNTLSPVTIDQRTPLLGQQHISVSAVAPAGAVYASLAFGAIITNATNSGVVNYGSVQFEPMWFVNKGVSYPTPDCNFSQVNSVQLPDGTTSRACRLFAGYVEDHQNFYVSKQRHTAVQCASSSKLLETAGLISASYTNTQDTFILSDGLSRLPANAPIIGQIATGQQNTFAPPSTLINGVVVDSISFKDATLKEVCNGLAAQSGSLYYIDAYYFLWYVPPSFVGTTVRLSDNPDGVTSFPYHDFSIEYDSTNPLNVAKVVGSKQQAAAVTDTFSGDGSTTVFSLSEPPFTTHQVTVGGSNIRTGVDGVDNAKFGATKTYKALINKQKQIITFATAPAAGSNNVVVIYTYEDQVISQIIAADAIGQQKMQFWGLVSDSNITSTTAAKNRGLKELTDYAFPRTILTLSSLNIYIPVGGLIVFTCASESMTNQPFVVQTVAADPQGGGVYLWNYTAGVYNPTLLDHIKNVHKAVKKTPSTANIDVIASIDVALFDSVHLNDSIVVNPALAGPYLYEGFAEWMKRVFAPQAEYRLDEASGSTAIDFSGNSKNGTLSGVSTYQVPGALAYDSDTAMAFTAGGGVTLSPGVPFASYTAATVLGWVNLSVGWTFIAFTLNGSVLTPYIGGVNTTNDGNGSDVIILDDFFASINMGAGSLDEWVVINSILTPTQINTIMTQASKSTTLNRYGFSSYA